MAFKNFPSELWVKVQETGSVNGLGKIVSDTEFTIDTIRVVFHQHGTAGGSETLQLKLYSDPEMTKEYAVSDVLTVSDFVTGTDWIGYIGFKFATLPNCNDCAIYAGLVATSYTRVGDSFYFAVPFDWPVNVNEPTRSQGCWIELYGYQARSDFET